MANAILNLRSQELTKATRVFNARGSKSDPLRCLLVTANRLYLRR
ncbi:hypothetical protein ALON55S_08437 [Alishewanella longhuensis]